LGNSRNNRVEHAMQEFFCRAAIFFTRAHRHGYASIGGEAPRGVSLVRDEADTTEPARTPCCRMCGGYTAFGLPMPWPLLGAESAAGQDLLRHRHYLKRGRGHAQLRPQSQADRGSLVALDAERGVFPRSQQLTPNQISVVSIVFAAVGATLLVFKPDALGLIGCALAIQGRLICNLLDGMVAIEGGKKSAVGAIYNEFPDRVADSLLIVALGYSIGWPALGWFGALAAALIAYIRVFGGSLGLPQDYRGPMAKQQRMAVLTAACVAGAAEHLLTGTQYALLAAAVIIAVGSVVTCVVRTRAIAAQLGEP
jgi:phosphatidylglycerophosphate synthase